MSTQITETTATVIVESPTTSTVEIITAGPQGPTAPVAGIGDIPDVDTSAAVANSVLYYGAASETWMGDDINTIITITDGGGF